MDELTIDEKVYVSSKRAAKITGYAKDYVGQLCREGRVDARLVGRNWYVLEASIMEHRFGAAPKDEGVVVGTAAERTEPSLNVAKPITDTWEVPSYIPEVPAVLPSLEAKQAAQMQDTRRVVSEMQEAWQEWFTEHAPAEEVLPHAPSAVDAHLMPATVSKTQEEVVFVAERDESVSITKLEQIVDSSSVDVTPYTEEVVHLHRAQTPEPVGDMEDLRTQHRPRAARASAQGSNLVLKSIFVGIAFIAVCVAMVGTGFVGDSLAPTGIAQPLVNALGGSWEYKSIK